MDLQGLGQLFKERIPTLQQLTSSKIARLLLYNLVSEKDFDENKNKFSNDLIREYGSKMEQSSQFLRDYIPHHLITGLIKNSIRKVNDKIGVWITYNKMKTLPDYRLSFSRNHLKCIVWRFNGEIDYTLTARKMLALDSLSQVAKFDIMCGYCLEDEFEKFTLNEELESALAKVISQRRPRLPFYWICKLKKDLRMMRFGRDFESLESFMVTKMMLYYKHVAFEYFWNRLSEQDQVDKTVLLLNRRMTVKSLQKGLLSKMNEFQLDQIVSKIPVRIIELFWQNCSLEEAEIAFSIWTRIKHLISSEQFGDLLHKVLLTWGRCSDGRFRLIIRIWDTACDHHRRFILDQDKDTIADRYCINHSLSVSKNLQFLYAMLSYSSPSYRKEFILQQGAKLIVVYHHYDVLQFSRPSDYEDNYSEAERVIKLCLPDESDVIEFKKQMMNSSEVLDLCKRGFSQKSFENLNKFIQFYAADVSAMNDFKKIILNSCKFRTKHIFLGNNWTKFDKFVDDAYPDASLAKNMKCRLILTSGARGLCDSMNADSLRSMINISAQLLNNEEMVKIKESLLKEFRGKIMKWDFWKSFDELYWQEFESFCFDGGKKINEFKSTIPIDEIFGQKLEPMISRHYYRSNFIVDIVSVMDNFLKWYFIEPEEVKEYKLRRIFEFNDSAIIEKLIASPGKKYIKPLLVWFLNNDEEQISKFKTEFSDKDVSQLI